MSLLDKVVGAITPPETQEERSKARARAREMAPAGGWLSQVLAHHEQIEQAFQGVRDAVGAAARRQAQQQLAALLAGHSLAEETVLYPALALHGEKAHSTKAYTEQSAAKVQLAGLEELDPTSQDYLDKLEHLRGAVLHHMYEEEIEYFPDLVEKADGALQGRLTARYQEEFGRYQLDGAASVRGGADGTQGLGSSSMPAAGTARLGGSVSGGATPGTP